jgi:hypothetical protein
MSKYLSERGAEEAQAVIDDLKSQAKEALGKIVEDVIGEAYTNVSTWIDSDSWHNHRQNVVESVCGHGSRSGLTETENRKIREAILEHHRDELIHDLNQDALAEIKSLKQDLRLLRRAWGR